MRYVDPDGRLAFAIPITIALFEVTWSACVVAVEWITIEAIVSAAVTGIFIAATLEAGNIVDEQVNAPDNTDVAEADKKAKTKKSVRTEPVDLEEQLTLEEALGGSGEDIMKGKIKDPNYPPTEWQKKEHSHEHPNGSTTTIHYWENALKGIREGFKFKNNPKTPKID